MNNTTKPVVLVVDDDLISLGIIVEMLMSCVSSYNVLQSNNADSAIAIAKDRLPNLIISDWDMPGKSGIDLIRELKCQKDTQQIPVIITTGFMLTPQDLKLAFEIGAMDYLAKPIQPLELEARVNSALMLANSFKQMLELKNNEINNNTLHMIEANEFVKSIPDKILSLDICEKDKEIIINALNEEIDSFLNSNLWNRFDSSFNSQHSDFYKNLLKAHPNLTPKELKLSALVFLGMSTKDIASILSQEYDSVKVNRYRLRKKLNLNEKENLQAYLSWI
jgi:DNA-binding response OmpR family regulator/DNA-binding CsgD family transcriptional regulator